MGRTSRKQSAGNSPPVKIAVVGLGPVGMILAVHLQEAGCTVAICDQDKIKINLIRREGIRLEGAIERQSYFSHIYTDVEDLEEMTPDILIVATKTYHVPALLEKAILLDREHLAVVSAQNGIDTELMLAEAFGESKTLRMVINFAGNLNAPNVVKVTFFNPPNYIASIDDSREEVANLIAEHLNSVKLDTKVVNSFEIIRRVWVKTILNASLSAICGIGKMTIREAMENPDTVEIIEQLIIEAMEVAEKEKIKFEDDFLRRCLRYLRKAGPHFPSMAVDMINNRPTEIDYFNGKIVEYGRKHYIRTPLHLAFTNMVKAITHKNILAATGVSPGVSPAARRPGESLIPRGKVTRGQGDHFLGIDLGSAYTKFTVIDETGQVVFQTLIKTMNRDRVALRHVMDGIHGEFPIRFSCATGYGRRQFPHAEIAKTEIHCGAVGVSAYHPGAKTIIDIGGEDIKVIRCDEQNNVDTFYLNDKCAAGTGAFITEIAERAELEIGEMSNLAEKSTFDRELNSFCTVFAKTEIMKWMFDGVSKEDIAKGIYISIANRVSKLRVDTSVPVYLIGGVAAHHPYLKTLLEDKFGVPVQVVENPIYVVSLGAALLARQMWQRQRELTRAEIEATENPME
ncbi:MAG: 2-dehydropantoate 2-reductase [Calditrichaeota bacterium]|nr:MAG: 2-dehydropantoate 2-reductase [Calditrichota bacterium]